MLFPSRINSSFWASDTKQAMFGLICILQMHFSHLPPPNFYFNKRPSLLNNGTDGEVNIHRPHLVMETQCNTLDHVLYITTDSAISIQFLFAHYLSTLSLFFLFPRKPISTLMWLKSLLRVPLGAFHNNCTSS